MKSREYLDSISSETVKVLKDLHVDKLFQREKRVRIAVTGLNRSGKTIFITSLINQLLSGERVKRLEREFVTRILPIDYGDEFPYRNIVSDLRKSPPKWPQSTSSISRVLLQLEIKSGSSFFPNRIIEVEITDYPGEWLLDLSMFGKNFEKWSEEILREFKSDLGSDFWNEIKKQDIYGYSGGKEEVLIEKYRKYLHALHEKGYSLLQPGRYLQEGNLVGSEIFLFTPLPKPDDFDEVHEESLYKKFQIRYEHYIDTIVTPLALNYFAQFDRQIILVDVIKSLNSGYDSFIDMTKAVKNIIEIYKYGDQSFLRGVLEKKIDRVLFAATKADYIASSQHKKYKMLLETVVEEAKRELSVKGVETKSIILSSVKSTKDKIREYKGRELHCLLGKVAGSEEETVEYTGELPEKFPSRSEWKENMFSFVKFSPTPFPDRDIEAVPHINMDIAIEYLIKDKI